VNGPDPLENGPTADRLRRTLAAVAVATPAPDRSAELLTRLNGAVAAPPAPPGPPGATGAMGSVDLAGPAIAARRAQPRRRFAVAAAVAVVVFGAGAVGLALRGAGDDEVEVGGRPVDTGWYLPPEGWEVTGVDTDFLDVGETGACPCSSWAGARAGDGAVLLVTASGPGEPVSGGSPVPVGDHVGTAFVLPGASAVGLAVTAGDHKVTVLAAGLETAELQAVAGAALDQRVAGDELDPDGLPLPDGITGPPAQPTPAWRSEHVVFVTAREAATGREITYQVAPAGALRDRLIGATDVEAGDESIVGRTSDEAGAASLVVLRGNEDLVVGGSPFGEPVDDVDPDELTAFADGLREVPTADWRAALAGAGAVAADDVTAAESLRDSPLVEP
jgi:hypothetical protein